MQGRERTTPPCKDEKFRPKANIETSPAAMTQEAAEAAPSLLLTEAVEAEMTGLVRPFFLPPAEIVIAGLTSPVHLTFPHRPLLEVVLRTDMTSPVEIQTVAKEVGATNLLRVGTADPLHQKVF